MSIIMLFVRNLDFDFRSILFCCHAPVHEIAACIHAILPPSPHGQVFFAAL